MDKKQIVLTDVRPVPADPLKGPFFCTKCNLPSNSWKCERCGCFTRFPKKEEPMHEERIIALGTECLIEGQAELIRKRLLGQRVYGIPVDLENEDIVLCAAFLLGRQEATQYESYPRFGPSEHKKGDEVDGLPKV